MSETSRLDKLVVPLKWGFLADNIILLLDRQAHGESIADDQSIPILEGAREFLELVQAAIQSLNVREPIRGDLGRVVESLRLFNYVVQSSPQERVPTEKISTYVQTLLQILDRWISQRRLDARDAEQIREFFRPISEITLREGSELVAFRRGLSVPE